MQAEFKKQVDAFVELGVDFLLAEYFEHIEEMEWAIEVLKTTGLPVCASMCIGPDGDLHGTPTSTCGVRMAKAGADVVGINCHFDPEISVAAVAEIKKGLQAEGITRHLMVQPLGYKTPDVNIQGFIDLPEFPFGKYLYESLVTYASMFCKNVFWSAFFCSSKSTHFPHHQYLFSEAATCLETFR